MIRLPVSSSKGETPASFRPGQTGQAGALQPQKPIAILPEDQQPIVAIVKVITAAELVDTASVSYTHLQQAFAGAPSSWEQIATPVPSTTGTEVYPWLGQSTQFREWVGERVFQNLKAHGYSIKNKTFENLSLIHI